jgi:hypothetical protein
VQEPGNGFFTAASSSTTVTTANSSKGFFPLAAGNYWIYRDSTFSNGKLASVSSDTDRIVSESNWNGKKTFILNDQKELLVSGDTLYQLTMQRTGAKFPTPVIIASEKEISYNYLFGGDVVMQKTVSKLTVLS